MTQQWDNESKRALIAYRINRADDTLKEAELMFQEGYYNGVPLTGCITPVIMPPSLCC